MASLGSTARIIGKELATHAPFTSIGALGGIVVIVIMVLTGVPQRWSEMLFWTCHPLHVLLSALVTTAMYRRHGGGRLWATLAVGYLGSVGVATLSDSVIPYVGEILLRLPKAEVHVGFIEKWWFVNPVAFAGIGIGYLWPRTKFPHAGHVLVSTFASLFHMTMALGQQLTVETCLVIFVFLFLSVWLPCCVSDIVFPLLFCKEGVDAHNAHRCSCSGE